MKTFYSSDAIEVTINFNGFSTGNYTYQVQEYAPINPDSPQQFMLKWTTIYTGTCFIISGTLEKIFNITDIVESRKEYYDNIVTTDGKRVNLLNQYRVVIINPTTSNPTISETAQVLFFEQYPNYKSEMNPLGIESENLLDEDNTYYPIVTPLIQGVENAQDTDDYKSIPVLTPRLPLNNYTYPLVSLATPAYQGEPLKITTEGLLAFSNNLNMEKSKLTPTFVTSIPMGSLIYSMYDTIPINPTNYFTVVDYDGITEEFSKEEYRNFNWSATSPAIYNVSFYLTDGTTEVPISNSTNAPGQTTTITGLLLSNEREEFIRTHNNVELVLKLEGNDETKYVSFDCSWFNEKYPKADDEQIIIWFSIVINYNSTISVDFGKRSGAVSTNNFSQIRKRRSGENSIWTETWFTYPNYDTNLYDSSIWAVTQPSDGEYEIRNINPLDVTLFEFRLQVIVGGTVEQDFRIFNPVNKFEEVVFDTSKPDFANILERINVWYPEAEIVLRVASTDPPIVDEGWAQIEITSLLRNLESYNGIYIQFTSGTDESDSEGKMHAILKFRNKDVTERCKIADIDTQQCTDVRRYYLMWQDRFGGFQCQPFEKTETYQEDFKRHEWATYQNAKRLGGIEIQPKWKLNTGFIDDEFYPYYESILVSPYIMLIDNVEDKTYRVLVNDSNYTEKTFKNQGRQLFNLELTVSQDKPQQILY